MPPLAGAGVRFDHEGLDKYVAFPAISLPGARTFEAWVTRSFVSGGFRRIVEVGTSAFAVDGSAFLLSYNGGSGWVAAGTVPAAGRAHLVVTAAGVGAAQLVSFYINGALVGTATVQVNAFAGQTGTIGRHTNPVERWVGIIAGVRVYDRALTADEVARRYAGLEVDRGLVLDLPLDEGVGVKALDRADKPVGLILTGAAGNFASVADVNDLGGDIELTVKATAADWTPAGPQGFVAKWTATAGGCALILALNSNGTLQLYGNTDGGNTTTVTAVSTAPVPATDGAMKYVRVTRVAATGVVTFATSDDGVTFTQLGTPVTSGVGSFTYSTAAVAIGSDRTSGAQNVLVGSVQRVTIRRGGVPILDADFAAAPEGVRTFAEGTRRSLVTVVGLAAIAISRYDGTLTGGAQWVQPKAERGIRGNPVTAAVPGVTADNPLVGATAYTIMAWARRAVYGTTADGFLVDFRDATYPADAYLYIDTNGSVDFSESIVAVSQFVFGQMRHVASVSTGTTRYGYVDGALVASGPQNGEMARAARMTLGSRYTAANGAEQLRDVALFNRALSQAEVRAVMLGLVKPTDLPGCVGYWPLEGDTLNRATAGRVNRLGEQFVGNPNPVGNTTGWGALGTGTIAPRPDFGVEWSSGAGLGGALVSAGPVSGSRFAVQPGERLRVEFDVAASVDTPLQVAVEFYTAVSGGAYIGSVTGALGTATPTRRLTISADVTVPATAAGAVVYVAAAPGIPALDPRKVWLLRGSVTRPDTLRPAAHGKEVNGPRLVRPRARGGLRFPEWLSAGVPLGVVTATVPLPASGYTFAAWARMRIGGPGFEGHSLVYANNANQLYWAPVGSSVISVALLAGATGTPNASISQPQGWGLVVASFDGALGRLYIDGVLLGTAAGTPRGAASTTLRLGGGPTGDPHMGLLADARVWSRALSDDEVAGLMAGQVSPFGLEGEWLTEGSISGAVALDTSGKGRHGTIVGAVAA
jgi:hypothetical protein